MHWVHLLSGRPLVRIQPGVPDFLPKALAARAFVFLPFLVFSCSILHAFSRLRPLFARGWAAAASNACSPRRFYPWSSFCSVSWERVNLSCRVVTDVLCTQIPLMPQRRSTQKSTLSGAFCMFVPAHAPSFASMASQTSSMSPTMP